MYMHVCVYVCICTSLIHNRLQLRAMKLQRPKLVDTTENGHYTRYLDACWDSEASATTVARNSGWHLDDKVKQSQANGLLHDPWTMQGLALPGTW